MSPFNPWHSYRVLNDFLSAKVATPYDMESTAMLFQEKVLTDAREFSAEIPCRSHLWGLAFLRTKKSLNPIGNADEGKKKAPSQEMDLKRKVCPSWESDIKTSFTTK